MNVAAAIATLWLFTGIQILFLTLYILVRARVRFRLSTRAAIFLILFWPDYLAGVIHHHRTKRKTET